jgi:hypothetical protein
MLLYHLKPKKENKIINNNKNIIEQTSFIQILKWIFETFVFFIKLLAAINIK